MYTSMLLYLLLINFLIMENETKIFRICYDGKLDYRATYTPIIKQKITKKAAEIGNKIDFFFVNSRWPRQGEL